MNLLHQMARFFKAVTPIEASEILDLNDVVKKTTSKRLIRARSDRFWPSSINNPYGCDRKEALSRIEKIYTDKLPPSIDLHRYGDVGNAIHRIVQTEYLGPSGMLFGGWRCINCRQLLGGFQTYPKIFCRNRIRVTQNTTFNQSAAEVVELDSVCADAQKELAAAGKPCWEYEEIRVFDTSLNISGRVDGVIVNSDAEWFTLELKTTSPMAFDGLTLQTMSASKFPAVANTVLENKQVVIPITRSDGMLPKNYHVSQASIYSELLLREARAGRFSLNPTGYRGTFIAYVNRNTLEIKSFLRRNSAAVFEYAANTVRNITRVVDFADKVQSSDPEIEAERVNKNREMVFSYLPKTCNSRTSEKAQNCPWQLVCFPYKDVSRNKVEHL